jgi:hypothetical protein
VNKYKEEKVRRDGLIMQTVPPPYLPQIGTQSRRSDMTNEYGWERDDEPLRQLCVNNKERESRVPCRKYRCEVQKYGATM